jgi:hypothetical protein
LDALCDHGLMRARRSSADSFGTADPGIAHGSGRTFARFGGGWKAIVLF